MAGGPQAPAAGRADAGLLAGALFRIAGEPAVRVLFVTGEFPPMQGGVGDYTRELGLALQDQGCGVHVATSTVDGVPAHSSAGAAGRSVGQVRSTD